MTKWKPHLTALRTALLGAGALIIGIIAVEGTQRGIINDASASLLGAALGAGIAVVGAAYISNLERSREREQIAYFAVMNLDSLIGDVARASDAVAAFLAYRADHDFGGFQFRMARDNASVACAALKTSIELFSGRMAIVEPQLYRLRLGQIDALQMAEAAVSRTNWLAEIIEVLDLDAPNAGAAMRIGHRHASLEHLQSDLGVARHLLLRVQE